MMARVELIAIHTIVTKDENVAPGKSFEIDEKYAQRLLDSGAAKRPEKEEDAGVDDDTQEDVDTGVDDETLADDETPTDGGIVEGPSLESLTVEQLKAMCGVRGLEGYENMKKAELIEALKQVL